MTTTEERRRNLIWGRETLEELAQDSVVPPEWRTEAAALYAGYPALERLQDSDDGDLSRLQEEHMQILLAAKWLFMQVQHHASSTEQRKYSLRVVLRHFV
ncbi:BPSL0761 family protein [Pelomonas sp. Root1444]|uniref:BPSL0761 family protein n=1 Tax=Pelomonas sp. Root1444 TaxID=1736464 RepID=UPI0007026692|nr:BPSL0761 family protein [Pelomonas sp. Root1444]KQY80852.1 hypothetical protein ASD35_03100 [Pelomonas sp. Root1444]